MVKDVLNKMNSVHPVTLVIIGWISFFLGLISNQILLKEVFLAAARVLPQILLLQRI
jgi:hypothetical protein